MKHLAYALLFLAACGGDPAPAGDDTTPDPDAEVSSGRACDGKPLLGSCDRDDGSGCIDTYGPPIDQAQAEADCENNGTATWSTGTCDTSDSVGGCERALTTSCTVTWLYPPLTETTAMQACPAPGVFVTP